MTDGSNRLPILLETIKSASVVFAKAEKMGAEAAYDMGVALVEAKALCQHGEWTDFLEQAGITPRSAQRYMRVVKAGMDRDYVSIVGLTGALEEIDDAQKLMPDGWQATMAVFRSELDPLVYIWWRVSQFEAGLVQAFRNSDGETATAYIIDSMPLYLVAFMINIAIERPDQYPELRRHSISFAERDRKIGILRQEIEQARAH